MTGLATAIGNYSYATYSSTAVGTGAYAQGQWSTAIGRGANSVGNNSVALGLSASAVGASSVALGAGSVADRDNAASVGTTTTQRQIINVADGTQANDAVNLGQMNAGLSTTNASIAATNAALSTTNTTLAATNSTLSTTNTQVASLNTDMTAAKSIIATHTTEISDINSQLSELSSGTIGLVQQAVTGADLTVGANTDGAAVNFAGTAGERTLSGVAAGTADSDAANVGQMNTGLSAANARIDATNVELSTTNSTLADTNAELSTTNTTLAATNSTLSTTNTQVASLNTDMTAAKGIIATHTTEISDINGQLSELSSGTIGLVQQATAGADLTVGANTDGTAVNFAGTAGDRTLSGVAAGTLDSDAVNVGQMNTSLSTTNASIAATNAELSTTNTTLAATNTALSTAQDTIATHTSEISTINNQLSELSSGTIGLVRQSAAGADLTVGANTDGAAVNFKGTAGERKLTGIAAGDVSTASTDAINGSQLHGVADSVASAIGGGSTVNPDGSISAPHFTIGDGTGGTTTVGTVAGAVSNLDGRTTANEGAVSKLADQIGSGTVGLVQQSAAGADLMVGANTDGAAVNFKGTAGERKLTGIAAGDVSTASTDAINGSQLHGIADSVASAIGGGSTVNPDGSISAPHFTIGDGTGGTTTVGTVAGAVSNLDGRTTANEGAVSKLADQIGSGTVGLVQQSAAGADLMVGANTDGAAVNFKGTAGERKLTGIAAGDVSTASTDAINGSQLHGVADSVASAIGGGSTVNPDGSISAPHFTIGDGSGGTQTVHSIGDAVTNLDSRTTTNEGALAKLADQIGSGTVGLVQQAAAGANLTVGANTDGAAVNFTGTAGTRKLIGVTAGDVSTASTDAINGGQLFALQEQFAQQFGKLDGQVGNLSDRFADLSGRVGDLAANPNAGGVGTGGDGSLVVGNSAIASGGNSSAVGQGAVASGEGSTSLGQGASATASGSVAIGQGSVATEANTVSFGNGAEEGNRRLVNLADGVNPSDAATKGQLDRAMDAFDQRLNDTNRAINDVAKNAYAGIAAAMAMPNMTPSAPGKTLVAVGAANFKSGSAVAAGATYRSRNGNWLVNGAVSMTSVGDAGVRAQVGYEF
ncbi:YadA-like family protein [Burkholderia cenocepacia]|uniref:YadA-like family protein n=1 Tax=Burkholderia cenocepacia TaxID=95486 RepID=UPI003F65AFC9